MDLIDSNDDFCKDFIMSMKLTFWAQLYICFCYNMLSIVYVMLRMTMTCFVLDKDILSIIVDPLCIWMVILGNRLIL